MKRYSFSLMSDSGKKPSKINDKPSQIQISKFFTIKQILQHTGILLKKNFFQLIGIIILLTLFSTLISIISLPSALWQSFIFRQTNLSWLTQIEADSTFILTNEQQRLYSSYSISSLIIRIFQWALGFFIPSALLLFTCGKLYHDIENDPDAPESWFQSIRRGFQTPKRVASSIIVLLILMWGIPIGIMLLFIPGIILMAFFFYSVFAIVIDEKEGREVFRGGQFYLKDNGWKTIVLLLIAFFIPWGLSLLYFEPLMKIIFPNGLESVWLDPTARNYGMLFLYFFCEYLFQYLLYFWFPVLYSVVFFDIQARKIDEQHKRKAALNTQVDVKIKKIEVTAGQRDYACLVCGAKMPLGQKKCPQCGEIFQIVIKRK